MPMDMKFRNIFFLGTRCYTLKSGTMSPYNYSFVEDEKISFTVI
jgi:hypothetical protein